MTANGGLPVDLETPDLVENFPDFRWVPGGPAWLNLQEGIHRYHVSHHQTSICHLCHPPSLPHPTTNITLYHHLLPRSNPSQPLLEKAKFQTNQPSHLTLEVEGRNQIKTSVVEDGHQDLKATVRLVFRCCLGPPRVGRSITSEAASSSCLFCCLQRY